MCLAHNQGVMKHAKFAGLLALIVCFQFGSSTLLGFAVNPGEMGGSGGYYPGRPGMVTGSGSTKGEAYMEAVRRLPRGAREGRPIYTQQGGGAGGITCEVRYIERSSVRGGGQTKAEARTAAMAKLPRGAEVQDVNFSKEGSRHISSVSFVKRGHVKGQGNTRQIAHREAVSKLPKNAMPGKVTYGGAEGRPGWLCELPYSWN